MEFKLNENQNMIRNMAVQYARDNLKQRVEEVENAEKFPDDLFQAMADIGFLSINMPETYGGLGMGYLETVIALEEISKISGSAGTLLTVSLLPLDAIRLYGTEEQKEKYLSEGMSGAWKGSFAFTESETGSDPKQLATTAVRDADGMYHINGMKRFISNAAYPGPMILFVKEKETEECTAFIINKFCSGYSISKPWEKIGFHGSHIYDVFFDDVIVTEDDILGKHGQGFDLLIGATAYGKLTFSAVFAGIMGGAEELAITYAQEKMHRGKPIAKFPNIKDKIARIDANTLSAKLMLYKAADDADTLTDVRRIQCSTARVKGYIADLAVETCVMCLNVLASYGVTKEFQVERFVRDSLIAPNIEGSADIQRLIAGGYLLRK